MRLRVRLRLSERKAESTRRREGLLIGGEEPQQLVLLARREQRGLGYRPPGARRRRASEGGHGGPFEHSLLCDVGKGFRPKLHVPAQPSMAGRRYTRSRA